MDDDIQLVREVIRASTPPVVCAGWSYGGGIMSLAVVGEPSVTHAVFVASLPFDPSDLEDASWIEADPHVVVHADGTYDIDSDWYVTDVEQHFSGEVREHLLSSPRRRVAMLTATDPPTVVGLLTIPMTVLFGKRDEGYSDKYGAQPRAISRMCAASTPTTSSSSTSPRLWPRSFLRP